MEEKRPSESELKTIVVRGKTGKILLAEVEGMELTEEIFVKDTEDSTQKMLTTIQALKDAIAANPTGIRIVIHTKYKGKPTKAQKKAERRARTKAKILAAQSNEETTVLVADSFNEKTEG